MSSICRACLQSVDKASFFYIDTFDNAEITNAIPKDVILLCVPELDLYISEHPGICGECLSMFETFCNFKNKCLESEDKIQGYLKKNNINSQTKVNLACVLYDVSEHMLCTPDAPENEKALQQIEENREVELIKVKPVSEEIPLLSCNDCSFVTMDSMKLANHKCVLISSEKYKCPHCEYATGRRYRLSYHINAKHTKSHWYNCPQCEYKTTDSSSLRRHHKVLHTVQDLSKMFTCNECDFQSMSQMTFQRHKVAKHGPLWHTCEVCNYQTRDKSNFRKHLYIHGDKPRKCTQCSYQCVSPYQLEKHYKRSHV